MFPEPSNDVAKRQFSRVFVVVRMVLLREAVSGRYERELCVLGALVQLLGDGFQLLRRGVIVALGTDEEEWRLGVVEEPWVVAEGFAVQSNDAAERS